MNSFGGAEEELRWGEITFNKELLYRGPISNATVAHFNTIYPAAGLRIKSAPISIEEFQVLSREELSREMQAMGLTPVEIDSEPEPQTPVLTVVRNEESEVEPSEPSTPPIRQKPILRIVK